MSSSDVRRRARRVAAESFGWDELRHGQEDAIAAVVDGTDTLCVMPTAYGKSAIYQVAGMLIAGATVVVSPLIALQRDQMTGIAQSPGEVDAVAVNSAQSDGRNEDAWESLAVAESEFIFLSPEQLAKPDVVRRLGEIGVSLFVVDEAHCISAWGHDFRPDYLRLGAVIEQLGHPATVALTATGALPVREEIVERLGMREPLVLTRGFDRPNLALSVARYESEDEKRDAVIDSIRNLDMPGLLYVGTRRAAAEYADALAEHGLRVAAYHAGLPAAERKRVHEAFHADELDVVAATNAFGMGIDKPNVRFVHHAAITASLDSYYQEIGRAGRDGEPADARLHYRAEDLGLRAYFTAKHADLDVAEAVVTALRHADGPVRTAELARVVGASTRKVGGMVGLLHDAAVLERVRGSIRISGSFTGSARDGAERAEEQSEMRERIAESRLEMMRGYAETTGCRRQFLLAYFGERLDEPCGNCDTCRAGTAEQSQHVAGDRFAENTRVRHAEWGEGTVMSTEDDRITVFFEEEGYRVLARSAIDENDLLDTI
ncbi:RecQ family ATP-dependent DNA helicase [Paramicrobacterium agarici]|uniref:RecQ family ATP-dependent DNA helicase n=1 Tax=Paramicrobacterium agarici TaxID=630514 RepID=UPI001153D1E7|nr:RecQ family ATP-dependent DNA helicase [Microbacterium agarici]TQO22820.1 ATP-dependent DNA helicase RecQ [Microbacterium agarici]